MSLMISDELLRQAGLTAQEALIEFACRLYDAGRLGKSLAAGMAHLSRDEFEEQLLARGLALFRPTPEDVRADVRAMERMGL